MAGTDAPAHRSDRVRLACPTRRFPRSRPAPSRSWNPGRVAQQPASRGGRRNRPHHPVLQPRVGPAGHVPTPGWSSGAAPAGRCRFAAPAGQCSMALRQLTATVFFPDGEGIAAVPILPKDTARSQAGRTIGNGVQTDAGHNFAGDGRKLNAPARWLFARRCPCSTRFEHVASEAGGRPADGTWIWCTVRATPTASQAKGSGWSGETGMC